MMLRRGRGGRILLGGTEGRPLLVTGDGYCGADVEFRLEMPRDLLLNFWVYFSERMRIVSLA